MHQIRVHLASIGHPCLGDPLYGGRIHDTRGVFVRQALHAFALAFDHPRTGARMEYAAPLPDDFTDFLSAHGLHSDIAAARGWVEVA